MNKRAQKLAIYLPSLRGGGAERVMVILANALAEYGYTVQLVVARAEGPYLRDVSDGVDIIDFGCSRIITSLPPLIHYLRTEKPDALLSALSHVNICALLARSFARVKTRIIISERNTLTAANKPKALSRQSLVRHLMRRVYRRADAIVGVSRGVSDDLANFLRLPFGQITTIYNPVVTTSLIEQAKAPLEHAWVAPDSPPIILGVGRLTRQKDFKTLIRAFARVRVNHRCRLVILGEGELYSELQALAGELGVEKDLMLFGFTDNPFSWMSRARVFVLSSAWEGLPGALIQAMACGAPVVSTDCPSGPSEILENGRWGRLTPVGDEVSLATAISATLNDTDNLNVSDRASDFSVDSALQKYLSVLLPNE